MNVAEEARSWFEAHGEDFGACLLRCLFHGWVFRTRDFFLLAEEVLAYPGRGVVDTGEDGPKNCWFLYYLGHARGIYTPYDYQAYAPYPHKYVAYKRRGKIWVREWVRLRRDYNIRLRRKEMNPFERLVGEGG